MGNFFCCFSTPSRPQARTRAAPNGIFIGLIGRTGSGMSQLIHDATGAYQTAVGPFPREDDDPYTLKIQDFGFTIPGIHFSDFPLYLIDTPGFNYTKNNDEYTSLQSLLKWIQYFKPHAQLDGLIFMHSVRSKGICGRLFEPRTRVMEDLCGQNWHRKLMFLTSQWPRPSRAATGAKEEEINAYWSRMLQKGSGTGRYDVPSLNTAWTVLRPFVSGALDARKQRIMRELESLQGVLKQETYSKIQKFVDRKMDFIQRLIRGLAEQGKAQMTQDEEITYAGFERGGLLLWREVKNQLDITELELWLTAGQDTRLVG